MPDWSTALFDDNPAEVDLLGLASIARAIAATVTDVRLDPVAVGINSPWGGGKSTALGLVQHELESSSTVLIVNIDPWEFVDSGDPRGTLIARVLDGLEKSYAERVRALDAESDLGKRAAKKLAKLGPKLNELRRRISWAKVAQAAVKSAVTMTPDLVGLVDALTPKQGEDVPESMGMKDFRAEFAKVLADLPATERVVVLVDDLDRCLPSDVLGVFEAVKLFLSVKRMSFVIAADEQFIRESLRAALSRHGRGRFADRYTEKVIQLPFTLPLLTSSDAEAYIALLYTSVSATEEQLAAIVAEATKRRLMGNAPYVTATMAGDQPEPETIARAAAMMRGMPSSTSSTPRQLKRFLNNLAVRGQLSVATRETSNPEIVMKLWVLEQNFAEEFRDLTRQSLDERTQLLRAWEAGGGAVGQELHQWANAGAVLSEVPDEVTAYLSLAASVITSTSLGATLGSDQALVLAGLMSDDQVARRAAQNQLREPSPGEQDVMRHLAAGVSGAHRDAVLDSLQQVGSVRPDLIPVAATVLQGPEILRSLQPADLVWLADYRDVLEALIELRPEEVELVNAARDELEGTGL